MSMKLLDARELDDRVELAPQFVAAQAVQRADQVHVVPAGEVAGEAGGQLQQWRHPAVADDRALVRDQYPGDELEQGATCRYRCGR